MVTMRMLSGKIGPASMRLFNSTCLYAFFAVALKVLTLQLGGAKYNPPFKPPIEQLA